ncbi:MAG: hypothetical protein GY787_32920 [Alteromonadales bacterium]|nr:hypothetical protein [Alteromonadales bacterium]
MSDSIKAWHEMQEEKLVSLQADEAIAKALEKAKYIFLLDFNDGKVYRYDISSLCNEENKWNPDTESCEAFLYGAGHKVNDCEWMVTKTNKIEYGN